VGFWEGNWLRTDVFKEKAIEETCCPEFGKTHDVNITWGKLQQNTFEKITMDVDITSHTGFQASHARLL